MRLQTAETESALKKTPNKTALQQAPDAWTLPHHLASKSSYLLPRSDFQTS